MTPRSIAEPVLQSRAQEAAQTAQKEAAAIGRGFQTLSVLQSASSADLAANGGSDIGPQGISIPGLGRRGDRIRFGFRQQRQPFCDNEQR